MIKVFDKARYPLLLGAVFLLLGGMWGGLLRMGWVWPKLRPTLYFAHGPLMVSGFLGTLIGIERAVALQKNWVFLAPLTTAIGGVIIFFDAFQIAGAVLITLGSFFLVLAFFYILRKYLVNYTVIMALGALLWFGGNLLWLTGMPVSKVVYWWAGFLILTIAGERLELGKLTRISKNTERLFYAIIGLFIISLTASIWDFDAAVRVIGVAFVGLSLWFFRNDIAAKTVRQTGLPRYVAICLLLGYAWLGFSGGMLAFYHWPPTNFQYDLVLHTLFLGAVFSLIFGHGPIIFPAILMRKIDFNKMLYFPLILLHLGLLGRVFADFAQSMEIRRWAGLANAITILLFFGVQINILRKSEPIISK